VKFYFFISKSVGRKEGSVVSLFVLSFSSARIVALGLRLLLLSSSSALASSTFVVFRCDFHCVAHGTPPRCCIFLQILLLFFFPLFS
jgi:hypothetical protein